MDDTDPEQLFTACVSAVLPAGQPLLLAVSGGSDSMGMLAAAVRWEPSRLAVVHVDHGLRPAADDDARLVREQCERFAIPCEVVSAPPDGGARTETAARSRRMAALATVARRRGCSWIALAHHRDDAHETLLLHLRRGHRGDRALASIPTLRSLGGGLRLLRPFLYGGPLPGAPAGVPPGVGRSALASFRERCRIPHREDPTNRDTRIPRNGVRAALAGAQAPLDPTTLERQRRAARRRLERRLGALATRMEQAWRDEGGGCVVDRAAWIPPPGETAAAWLPELLRLLGAGLARPRTLAPRASVVAQVEALLSRGSGSLSVPAAPSPLVLRASRVGVHLPSEPLPGGSPAGRILAALSRTSLYL